MNKNHMIYEKYYQSKIPKGYIVHHIDLNPQNNDPLNLTLVKNTKEHFHLHKIARQNGIYKSPVKITMAKEVRLKMGWSQVKMAAELNVSFATVRNWESGNNQPSRLAQEKIDQLIRKEEGK